MAVMGLGLALSARRFALVVAGCCWLVLAVAGRSCLVSVVSGFIWFFFAVFGHSLPWLALVCPGLLYPRLGW